MFSQKSKAVLLTILAGALWGTSFPIIKIGLTYTDPFAFLFWRFLVSSVALVAVMLLLRKLEFKMGDMKLLVFLGIANGAGYLLQYVGMNYTTAAKAALFINLSAMWVALLSPKLLGESFSKIKLSVSSSGWSASCLSALTWILKFNGWAISRRLDACGFRRCLGDFYDLQ